MPRKLCSLNAPIKPLSTKVGPFEINIVREVHIVGQADLAVSVSVSKWVWRIMTLGSKDYIFYIARNMKLEPQGQLANISHNQDALYYAAPST
jgi:hypothetical protein